MNDKEYERVKGFIVHGVHFTGERGNQFFGECTFCGGRDKLHVNKETLLWDCKKCNKMGNFTSFLEEIVKRNVAANDKEFMEKLCINRKLPMSAFEGLEFGRDGKNYTFPVRDDRGRVQDVRMYKPGSKVMGTARCSTGLMGFQNLRKCSDKWPIFLCEGEWDFMAMRWLLTCIKQVGVPLGVPGAIIFKKEWIRHFQDRTVYVLYDKDNTGEDGELVIKERLTGCAKVIKYLHWPQRIPDKFDIRDLIALEAVKKKKPRKTYKVIMDMLQDRPRKNALPLPGVSEAKTSTEEPEIIPERKSLQDIYTTMRKWLFLASTDPIDVMLSVVISNKLEGDPLWLFLVSPPGGAKTEILSSLITSPDIYFTSSLTPHALISGASWTSGSDPSLIPKLNGKILAIKDFTSIMSKRDTEKEEIFGILRDAFDGRCSKVFGNGVVRKYESKFTILSAVTPAIYELSHSHQALGERFLKYTMGSNLLHISEEDIVLRSINNLNRETTMRKEMSETVQGFLYHLMKDIDSGVATVPVIPDQIKTQLVSLAMFCARMRGTVARDKYRPDMINSKPSAEVGSRLGKQLAKFCISYAMIRGLKEVTEKEYAVCKKIALDTISQRNEDVLKELYKEVGSKSGTIRTRQLSFLTCYPHSTISRILSDMQMLEIVSRVGKANSYEWKISDYMMDLISKAKLYTHPKELEPKLLEHKKVIKVRRKI